MARDAAELSRRLAQNVETVCRHYLSSGRRQGRYWLVGNVRNTPGRSMFVRLSGPDSGPGAAGHWTDAASSEHGDLLDVIRKTEAAEQALLLAIARASTSAGRAPWIPTRHSASSA